MKKTELYIKSTNNENNLHTIVWEPEGDIEAIVQISHGMIEYIDRYDRFARFLNSKRILVVGNDHLGHGLTAKDDDELGYFPTQYKSKTVVDDLYEITKEIKSRFGEEIPYFVLGHSMGSFMIRRYIMTYGDKVDGAVIVGTGSQPKVVLKGGKAVLKILKAFKGDNYRSKFVEKMAFGTYNKKFEPVVTQNDWISRDKDIVHKYVNDKYCTFLFTLNGYETLFDVLEFIQSPQNKVKIPNDLPLLFVAGDMDPVGNYGKSVKQVYNNYKVQGVEDIDIKLYKDGRHEILNELNYEDVYNDIYNWLKKRIENTQKAF